MNFSTYTINTSQAVFFRTYEIYNERGEIEFVVQGKAFSKSFWVRDFQANDLYKISNCHGTFHHRFEVLTVDGEQLAELRKSPFRRNVKILTRAGEWQCITHRKYRQYELLDHYGNEVASISRRKRNRKSRYGLAIKDGQDDAYIIALVVVLDRIIRLQKANSQ